MLNIDWIINLNELIILYIDCKKILNQTDENCIQILN